MVSRGFNDDKNIDNVKAAVQNFQNKIPYNFRSKLECIWQQLLANYILV